MFVLFGLGVMIYDSEILVIKIFSNIKKIIKVELFFFVGISNFKVF